MAELLAWDGVWSRWLLELMFPVALEMEADDAQRQFGAVSAAIAGSFKPEGAKPFLEGLNRVRREARGESSGSAADGSPAKKMLEIFGKLNLAKAAKGAKRGR